MTWSQILASIALTLFSGMGVLILVYFKKMAVSIDTMSMNMIEMNIKLERVITDQDWHRLEIKDIKIENKEIKQELKELRG